MKMITKRNKASKLLLATALTVVFINTFLSLPPQVKATFPGRNGMIAFAGYDGDLEIFVMNPDGTGVTQLTYNTLRDRNPDWSPDGSKIAFSTHIKGDWEIFIMYSNGTGLTQLTNNTNIDDTDPAWSPNGSKIAFSRSDGTDYEIFVMNSDGTGATPLTNDDVNDYDPAWSPDGGKIAFEHGDDSNAEIYVMNSDGTGATPLTSNTVQDRDPDWSPDGSKIVFSRFNGNYYDIFVMNFDGTNVDQLTDDDAADYDPVWSPDGTTIALERWKNSSDPTSSEIFVVYSNGTGLTQLTNNTVRDWDPDWQSLPYDVTIKAHCFSEGVDVSVSINMDGLSTGFTTPHTFTDLTGIHNFTVPNTDANGHPFKEWSTGETATTITVGADGTYTAYYQANYTLTVTTTTGGTTSPSPGSYSYWDGTKINVTAIPETTYVFDRWELDSSNVGSQNPITVTMNQNHTLHAVFIATYNVTIKAYCNTEGVDVGVSITKDGLSAGYNTPHSFTNLTGTHNFTVPNVDSNGHPFKEWSTGETTTTITVDSDGTYTAYYEARPVGGYLEPVNTLAILSPYMVLAGLFGVGVVVVGVVAVRKKRKN